MLCTRATGTPGEARAWIRDRLTGELRNEAIQALELIGSELVTNAIRHTAEGAIELCVAAHSRQVRIEVSDHDPDCNAAVVPMRDDWAAGGRGLRLVEAYSARWGCTVDGPRKIVWAELDVASAELRDESTGS